MLKIALAYINCGFKDEDSCHRQPVDDKYGFCYKGNMIYVYLSDSFTVTSLALPSVNKGFKAKKACLLDDKQKVKASQKGGIITLQGDRKSVV